VTATVRLERRGAVAVVTLDRPERRNAMDETMLLVDLPAVLGEVREDADVRAVVVTGAGDVFCAGADLRSAGLWAQPTPADMVRMVRRTCGPAVVLADLPRPTVAAVNGPAIGAGLGLAVACDFRIASPAARFRAPFVSFGCVPDFGLTWQLPRIVGGSRALDILLTCRTVDAHEAIAIGLVNRLDDTPLDAAVSYAELLAGMPADAVQATRRNLRLAFTTDLETEVLDNEATAQGLLMSSPDFAARFDAYRSIIITRP
jgi:enoyl-CoA hydratase/carnithine racemase